MKEEIIFQYNTVKWLKTTPEQAYSIKLCYTLVEVSADYLKKNL